MPEAESRARFVTEKQVLRRLSPHLRSVPALLDPGEDGEWFVMELLDGLGTLAAWAKARRPAADHDKMLLELAFALDQAHHLRVYHRDLKPSNVYVMEDRVVLLDWGSAIDLFDPNRNTATGHFPPGTRPYHPPDASVLEKEPTPDKWAAWDMYQLGRVYEELLTGRLSMSPSPVLLGVQRWRSALWHCMTRPWPDRISFGSLLEHPHPRGGCDRDETLVDPSEARPPQGPPPAAAHTDYTADAQQVDAVQDPAPAGAAHTLPMPPRRRTPWVAATVAATTTLLALVGLGVSHWSGASAEGAEPPITEAPIEPAAADAPTPATGIAAPPQGPVASSSSPPAGGMTTSLPPEAPASPGAAPVPASGAPTHVAATAAVAPRSQVASPAVAGSSRPAMKESAEHDGDAVVSTQAPAPPEPAVRSVEWIKLQPPSRILAELRQGTWSPDGDAAVAILDKAPNPADLGCGENLALWANYTMGAGAERTAAFKSACVACMRDAYKPMDEDGECPPGYRGSKLPGKNQCRPDALVGCYER